MKKKITTLLFIGVIAMISMGFRPQPTGDGFSGGSTIKIIKGTADNTDGDKYWDQVTFGVAGLARDENTITSVEILDKNDRSIGWVDDWTVEITAEVSWYSIDLDEFKIKESKESKAKIDFQLKVHIVSGGIVSMLANGVAPIVPEETVVILKFP